MRKEATLPLPPSLLRSLARLGKKIDFNSSLMLFRISTGCDPIGEKLHVIENCATARIYVHPVNPLNQKLLLKAIILQAGG
jgi:hypothetical protein